MLYSPPARYWLAPWAMTLKCCLGGKAQKTQLRLGRVVADSARAKEVAPIV